MTAGQGNARTPIPLPARELADRIRDYLIDELCADLDDDLSRKQLDRIMARLGGVITDAAAWRSYWDPAEHAARVEAELTVQREMDAAEWAPVARHVRATAQRMITT